MEDDRGGVRKDPNESSHDCDPTEPGDLAVSNKTFGDRSTNTKNEIELLKSLFMFIWGETKQSWITSSRLIAHLRRYDHLRSWSHQQFGKYFRRLAQDAWLNRGTKTARSMNYRLSESALDLINIPLEAREPYPLPLANWGDEGKSLLAVPPTEALVMLLRRLVEMETVVLAQGTALAKQAGMIASQGVLIADLSDEVAALQEFRIAVIEERARRIRAQLVGLPYPDLELVLRLATDGLGASPKT